MFILDKNFRRALFVIGITISLFLAMYLVSQRTYFFGKAAGVEANLVIDTSVALGVKSHWKSFAQGGEESKPMLGGSVTNLVKNLQPEYIRLDHIYDFYEVAGRGPSGELTFN